MQYTKLTFLICLIAQAWSKIVDATPFFAYSLKNETQTVTLIADVHENLPNTLSLTQSFFASLSQLDRQNKNKNIRLLFEGEGTSDPEHKPNLSFEELEHTFSHLQRKNHTISPQFLEFLIAFDPKQLYSIQMEDIEFRDIKIANFIYDKFDKNGCTISFTDLITSLKKQVNILNSIAVSSTKHSTYRLFHMIKMILESFEDIVAKEKTDDLIICLNSLIKNCLPQHIQKSISKNGDSLSWFRRILKAQWSLNLFDAIALAKIGEAQNDHIIIVAGADHINNIANALLHEDGYKPSGPMYTFVNEETFLETFLRYISYNKFQWFEDYYPEIQATKTFAFLLEPIGQQPHLRSKTITSGRPLLNLFH